MPEKTSTRTVPTNATTKVIRPPKLHKLKTVDNPAQETYKIWQNFQLKGPGHE